MPPETRIFFLSHSTADKPLVRLVADALGKDRCWIDEGLIRPGENLLERIDNGIADSRMFVLFWSRTSATSAWVREEMSQARLRALRDRGYRLVLVKLDETPIPVALAHRLFIDQGSDIKAIASELTKAGEDLTPTPSQIGGFIDPFQGRDAEITALEQAAVDSSTAGTLVLGLSGMGKTAVVRRAATQVFPHLLPIWIDIDTQGTPLRLLASIARPLSLSIDIEAAAASPIEYWQTHLRPEVIASEKIYVVLDNVRSSRSYQRLPSVDDLITAIVEDLSRTPKRENPGIIAIATVKPMLPEGTLSRLDHVVVRSLTEQHMVRALRAHLRRTAPDLACTQADLAVLAAALKGYPLALGLAAAQIAQRGLRQVIDDVQYLHELVIGLASELIAGISLSKQEKQALIILAVHGRPARLEELTTLLGSLYSSVPSLLEKQLFDVTHDTIGLHAIIQEYVRERLASKEQITEAHAKIASLYKRKWQAAAQQTAAAAEYGSLATFHSLAAGQRDAADLATHFTEEFKEAAIDLYRQRQYALALDYLERVRSAGRHDSIVNFYYALTLNRLGRSQEALTILSDLTKRYPNTSRYHHAVALAYRKLGDHRRAVNAFRRAVATCGHHDTVPVVGLADELLLLKQPKDALVYAEMAYKRDPSDSLAISTLASTYHALGENARALELLQDSLRRRTTDARLHARAGIIAKSMGDFLRAEKHLKLASADRSLGYIATTLADVYIELGRYSDAEVVLDGVSRDVLSRDPVYWLTKSNLLRRTDRLDEALIAAERVIKLRPKDIGGYGSKAQVQLEIARAAAQKGQREESSYRIEVALKTVREGLEVEPSDAALGRIREELLLMENLPEQ